MLCWIGGFLALAQSLAGGASGLLARWAVTSAVAGASVVIVEYAVIGHSLKQVADAWAGDPGGSAAAAALAKGDVMLAISAGLFHSFVAWMLGLPFVLLGLAVVLGGGYPRWLGWAAAAAGSGALVSGVTRFLGVPLVPYPLLYGGFVMPLCLWLVVVGASMWRRAG